MPGPSASGRFQKASSMPSRIPTTGLPITGKAFPINHAGTASAAASRMPGRRFISFFIRITPRA